MKLSISLMTANKTLLHSVTLVCFIFIILFVVAPYQTTAINNKPNKENILIIRRLTNNYYEPVLGSDSITIPLRRVGRLFLIEAQIDDQIGNLIFDTGAMGLVLNKTYFRNHLVIDDHNSNGINGAISSVSNTTIDKVNISELKYKNVRADLTDLGHIENKRGVKILGLLGFSMIKGFEILIDVNHNQLKLFKIDKKGNRVNMSDFKFHADLMQPIETANNILFLKASIGGKKLNFCLDTGSETNVISSNSSNQVLNTINITRRSALQGSGSKNSEVLYGNMSNFILGNQSFTEMETIITNLDALSDAYGVKIDGVLGYNFLNKGIICINLGKKQLSICFAKSVKI
ncbi:MAG: retropepsin-like domain-containing protein [Bacteroidetes bacterium]|nr:retropepsin-like domain-containing protein [Bacteroidota bacterium]